jgi:hypothetical protein
MSQPLAPRQPPTRFIYQGFCLAGLVLVLFSQLGRPFSLLDFLTLGAGLLGIVTRWRVAPFLFLLLLGMAHVGHLFDLGPSWQLLRLRLALPFETVDNTLSCGVLIYVAAHFRLQGLTSYLVPPDRREREKTGDKRSPIKRYRRALSQVMPRELALFLLPLPVFALLAQLALSWVDGQPPLMELVPVLNRSVRLAWLLGVTGLVVAGLLAYWRWSSMSQAEAAMFVQDVWWRETRGEQRRLWRWLAWTRLRAGAAEERKKS